MKLKIIEIIEETYPPGPERDAALKKVYDAVAEIFAVGVKEMGIAATNAELKDSLDNRRINN